MYHVDLLQTLRPTQSANATNTEQPQICAFHLIYSFYHRVVLLDTIGSDDAGNMEYARPPVNGTARSSSSPQRQYIEKSDQAYKFLAEVSLPKDASTTVDVKRLRRMIDWYIVPIMFLCYTMQFCDKVSLNYAAVMGLNKDLKLTGDQFSNAASAFFYAYLAAELPTGYILNKVPAGKWLGLNVILWGMTTACTAAAHSYQSLLAARIFLGLFEAAIAPCLILISSQYYTKSEQAPRFSFWYCGLGIGQIIGGAVSYGFQHVQNPSLQGWRTMFVTLGAVTTVIGFATLLLIPDSPVKAKFMNDVEKAALLRHVAENRTGVDNKQFKPRHILEVVKDAQLYLLCLITICISIPSGVVSSFSATLIRNIGYTPAQATLLNMPSGIVSIFATLLVGFGVRHSSNRWAWIVACCIPALLGGALMSFLPSARPHANKAGLLAGIYLINFVVPTLSILYQWTASNIAGSTKRAVSTALISAAFGAGNIIGPQTFRAHDAPQYIPAKVAVLVSQAVGATLAVVLFVYYRLANARKEKQQAASQEDIELSGRVWENLTDREDGKFRYVY